MGTSLVVQWLRLGAPKVRGPGSIPAQETRSHMQQLRPGKTKEINLKKKERKKGTFTMGRIERKTSCPASFDFGHILDVKKDSYIYQPRMLHIWTYSFGLEGSMEEGMATHSSILPGESHGQRSLTGYSP